MYKTILLIIYLYKQFFRCYVVNFKNLKLIQIGGVIDRGFAICLCGLGIIHDPFAEKYVV